MGERRTAAVLGHLTRAACAALDPVLSIVFAPACAACGGALDRPTSVPVCAACWRAVRRHTPPLCDGCGSPLPAGRTDPSPCRRCRGVRRLVTRARAVGEYDGVLRDVVHALKYDGRRSLARPVAALMRTCGEDVLDGAAAVVPVPLHRWRRLARGFNQAAELARHLDLPVVPALARVRATPTQTSLPARRRRLNVVGAFEATRAADTLRGRIVVLVDDVSTTGATLDACAGELRRAGVGDVRALTACRVATERP